MASLDLQSTTTSEFLATEYLSLRLEHFNKLAVPVRKLVLEIVQFYLGQFYFMDDEASSICNKIEDSKSGKDEALLSQCYKDFLNFLPIRFRAGIQGENLFKQPSKADPAAHYYANVLDEIIASNKEIFKMNDSDLSQADLLRVAMLELERTISNDGSEDNQPAI